MALTALAGCAYRGGVENPLVRKATWFSYVGGDDIRAQCALGRPAQYRLVYNAAWDEQVRTYDLRRGAIGEGAVLDVLVFGGSPELVNIDPFDPTAKWRGATDRTQLGEAQYLDLIRAIEASGFGNPTPSGLALGSWRFYWAVSACAEGRFHFYAWLHPRPDPVAIQFAALLFAADRTGVKVNPPRATDARYIPEYASDAKSRNDYQFELRVGRDGLVGNAGLF